MRGQAGLVDVDDRRLRLSNPGNQLGAYARVVDFEAFRPELDKALSYTSGPQEGRPPYDPVIILKVPVIQTASNLSDERSELLINDCRDPSRRRRHPGRLCRRRS